VYAVKKVGASIMSVVDLLQRPIVVFLSSFIFAETITFLQVMGILLVTSGIGLVTSGRFKR
jgi:drug/metabolite transporter (DMT)-like permease